MRTGNSAQGGPEASPIPHSPVQCAPPATPDAYSCLPGNNNYSGATTINAGTLQIGNGGASGALNNANAVADNDTFIFNSTSTLTLNSAITGSGNVIVRKGTLQAIGNNSYTGWTQIDPGATFQACSGPVGGLASSVVTNNGTLLLIRQ